MLMIVAFLDAFGDRASHGVIVKTHSDHLAKEAQGRDYPASGSTK